MPATLSIITNTFPPHERGQAIGTWAGVSALALAIGPVLGGVLVEHVSWQSIFFINLPVAAVAIVVTRFATRESRDETVVPKVDIAGISVITIGLTALTLALVEAPSWGWGSARILALFVVAAIGIACFAGVERRVSVPMIDFAFFGSRTFLGTNIVAFIVSFAMLSMFFFLTLYMQNVLRYSPLEAGVRFLPTTLMVILIAPIAGRFTDRIGPRPLITLGLALVAGSMLWQSFLTPTSGFDFLFPGFVLMGIGIALVMSPMSTAAMNAVDQTKAGVASGILSMSRMIGGVLGVAVLGTFIGQTSSVADFVDSLGQGLMIGAFVAAAGAVIAWWLISPELAGGAARIAPATGEAPAPAVEAAGERVGA
jgi:EmrB/QacA subfamily drug resistance transporter